MYEPPHCHWLYGWCVLPHPPSARVSVHQHGAIPEDWQNNGHAMRSWVGTAWRLISGILTFVYAPYSCTWSSVTLAALLTLIPIWFQSHVYMYIADCKGDKYTLHYLAHGKCPGSESLGRTVEHPWVGHCSPIYTRANPLVNWISWPGYSPHPDVGYKWVTCILVGYEYVKRVHVNAV